MFIYLSAEAAFISMQNYSICFKYTLSTDVNNRNSNVMVKHIVLFKLKDEVPETDKLVVMNKFKEAIEALPAKISVIRKIEVGLNMNPGESWHIALYSEFDNLDDVKFYATHPDHVAAGKIIAEAKESRSCVDYEIV